MVNLLFTPHIKKLVKTNKSHARPASHNAKPTGAEAHRLTSDKIRSFNAISKTSCPSCEAKAVACFVNTKYKKSAACTKNGETVEYCGVNSNKYVKLSLDDEAGSNSDLKNDSSETEAVKQTSNKRGRKRGHKMDESLFVIKRVAPIVDSGYKTNMRVKEN